MVDSLTALLESIKHDPDVVKANEAQVSAIAHTEVSYRDGLLNFVETVSHQKDRWKRMNRVMRRAKHARRESFLFMSPVPIFWQASFGAYMIAIAVNIVDANR